MLKASPPRKGFFDHAEYEAPFHALPNYARVPLAFGYFTGMRKGEALGLRWEQVDFLRSTIALHAERAEKAAFLRSCLNWPRCSGSGTQSISRCAYVCYRLDKYGRAVRIKSLRRSGSRAV